MYVKGTVSYQPLLLPDRVQLPDARSRGNPPMVKGMRGWNFPGKMDAEIPTKTSRLPEAQIRGVLRRAEGGMPVPELCREHGISCATFCIEPSRHHGFERMIARRGQLSAGRWPRRR